MASAELMFMRPAPSDRLTGGQEPLHPHANQDIHCKSMEQSYRTDIHGDGMDIKVEACTLVNSAGKI